MTTATSPPATDTKVLSDAPSDDRALVKARFTYIDTLRGFAACAVFLLHVHGYWLHNIRPEGLSFERLTTLLAAMGGLGVDLFIVLSGFCLFYPLIRSSPRLEEGLDTRAFYRRRAYRLLPAYYAAMLVATLLALTPLQPLLVGEPIQITDFLAHLLLIQTFSSSALPSINGSLWSIALEAQLYIVFPLLILIYRRWGINSVIITGMVAAVSWPLIHSQMLRLGIPHFSAQYHFPARWIEFIGGMVAAILISRPFPRQSSLAATLFIVTLPLTMILHTGLLERWGLPIFVSHSSAAVTFGALVVLLASIPEKVFASKSLLRIPTQIGVISYSLYLLHQPILLITAPLASRLQWGIIPTFALSIATVLPATVLCAYIFYIVIERPFLERGKRLSLPKQRATREMAVKSR